MEEPKNFLKEKLIRIFNPDTEDFEWTYDVNGDKNPVKFIMPPMKSCEFPEGVAVCLKKHLAEKIVWKRGIKTNYDDEFDKIMKLIEMNV